jgi:hypothetical protein
MRRKVSEQVLVQLIEADVESGFGLVDEAKVHRIQGNNAFSARALEEAEAVVADIERRLAQMGDSNAAPFHLLVAELRNAILAEKRNEWV